MATTKTKNFYKYLPSVNYNLNKLLSNAENFEPVPSDWCIIMTDIVDSTVHFKAEKYQEINLIAVSSVSVVLNTAKHYGVTVPFVYGGDGATFVIPPVMLSLCKQRLATLKTNTMKSFGMDLRVSIIPMSAVNEAGFPIRVAKLHISSHYQQAIFLGEGIRYAESLMKHSPEYLLPKNTKHKPIDLSGLECRWSAIFPPRPEDEVLSLIVLPTGGEEPEIIFDKTLDELERIYGSFEERHPIHPRVLSPTTNLKTILHSSHLRFGDAKFFYILTTLFSGFFKWSSQHIRAFFHRAFRGSYPDMSTSSDTLKIDNSLKTIFAGTPEKRVELLKWLDKMEKEGDLIYGLNVAKSSVMTCYIKELQNTHIRFIDGFGGGYTLASVGLKKKIKERLPKK